MLIFVYVESTVGTDMVLVEPGFYAIYVEVVFTAKVEHLIASFVDLQADCAHLIRVYFRHSFDR